MARIRTIKPEFWVSEQIAECSTNARLTFIGLWNFCDDQGVHPAKAKTLKAELYPMDDITSTQISEWVGELIRVGLVREFEASNDGERYWHVTGWERHQRIDRPSYKHPAPPTPNSTNDRRVEFVEGSTNQSDEPSSKNRRAPPPGVEGNGKEGNVVGGRSLKSRSTRPAGKKPKTAIPANFAISERVSTWATERGYANLEGHLEAFVGKCLAKGYRYADWDEAFIGAIRGDWAKLNGAHTGAAEGVVL